MISKFDKLFGILFGIFGSAAVLLLAYSRHGHLNPNANEWLIVAASFQIIHSLLGLVGIYNINNKSAKIALWLIIIGIFSFCIPIELSAFGIINGAKTAPIGGIAFALSWIFMGISASHIGKNND